MKKLIPLLIIAAALMTGCMREDAVKFHEIENISISVGSTVAVNTVLLVENTSGRKITLSDAVFHVSDAAGNEIGTVMVADELVLPKKSTVSLHVPVRIKLSNPFVGLSLVKNLSSEAPRLLVNGSAKIKAGGLRKKYKVENMPLSKFISIFEGDTKAAAAVEMI